MYSSGSTKKWRFQFRTETGQQIRRRGFATRTEAASAMKESQEAHDGVFAPTNETVGSYLQRWLDERSAGGSIKESTADSYRRTLKPVFPVIGQLPLQKLTADHLDQLYRELLCAGGRNETGRSPQTVRYVHTVRASHLPMPNAKAWYPETPPPGRTRRPATRLEQLSARSGH